MARTGSRPSNLLALAVLALLFERPMHPYEMAAKLKERGKEDSIKLRYGSLYTVIEQLTARGLIAAAETSREGRRPERTVYRLTPAGLDMLRDWMGDLLREPTNDYPPFESALSLLAVLPPDEVVALLRRRALHLAGAIAQMEAQLAALARQDIAGVSGNDELTAALAGQKFPALFAVEGDYRLAMTRAELAFVNDLVRRIVEEGWGPIEVWRSLQAQCEQQHQSTAKDRE